MIWILFGAWDLGIVICCWSRAAARNSRFKIQNSRLKTKNVNRVLFGYWILVFGYCLVLGIWVLGFAVHLLYHVNPVDPVKFFIFGQDLQDFTGLILKKMEPRTQRTTLLRVTR